MKKITLLVITLLSSVFVFSQDVLMQNGTINQCSGTLYDSGGAAGNYSSNENFVLTICPENPGQRVQLQFTSFSTQLNQDILTIYDGDSVAADSFGQFSGGAGFSPGFVSATQDNTSGCVTLEFTSNASGVTSGWAATISCITPCQTINSLIESSTPAPNALGYIRVCPDEEITLNGNGTFSIDGTGATYEWDLGDGNTVTGQSATFSYPDPGVYIVNLNIRDTNTSIDPLGCTNNNLINQVIQVATEPDFTGTQAADSVICFGESTTIDGVVTPVEFINDCTPPVSGTTFLPDGSGVSYQTSITVDCYDSAQTLSDINQLISICITMEHSYLGDLDIEIISPNGQVVRMHDQGGGSANLGIPWATAPVDGNSANTTPGVGSQYCFVPGNANPTLVGGIQAGGTFPSGNGPGTYTDTFVPAGNYSSVFPLTGLVGSPLNGNWTIRIVDNIGADNGYIFEWSITFDPNLQPPELSFTPVIDDEGWDPDPSIVNTTGNVITVAPPTAGIHCYTYRVTDDFGCEYTEEVCIEVLPEIINSPPNNLYLCNPGAPPYIFDLTENTPVVLSSTPVPADYVVTYHETQGDADADTGAIDPADAYVGTDGQVIYVRLEYLTSGCYSTESFTLNITGQPDINAVPDLEVCDDAGNDGFAQFDLEGQTLGILGAQAAADFTVTYYTSFANADTSTGALSSPYTNISNPQAIYVRIESVGDASCNSVGALPLFNLVVLDRDDASFTVSPSCNGATVSVTGDLGGSFAFADPQPSDGASIDPLDGTVTGASPATAYGIVYTTVGDCPASSTQPFTTLPFDDAGFTMTPTCDGATATVTGLGGGTFSFSSPPGDSAVINPADGTVTGGTPGASYTVTYTTVGDCPNTSDVTFTVNPLPLVVAPTPLEVCDDNVPDGLTEIDLTLKNAEVTGNTPTSAVSYYLTQSEADAGDVLTALPIPYTNVSNPQTVYVRVENVSTGCYGTTALQLIVEQAPVANVPAPLEYCDPDSDGFGVFDIAGTENEITGGVAGLSVTYHETLANAENGVNELGSPYNNIVANTQTIYVRIESATIATDCATIVPLVLIVNPTPQIEDPGPLQVCDDASADGFAQFDLTDKNAEILDGLDATQYLVSYYEAQADAEAPTNVIAVPTAYTNTVAFNQTLWVRVDDTANGCYKTTTLDLIVNALPVLVQPTELNLCDVNNPGDEAEAFNLEDANAQVLNGQTGITLTYYETQANANSGADEITSPYVNTSNPQTVYIRAENDNTGCVSTITLTLRVNPIPSPAVPNPIEVCDGDNDGFASFDLESRTLQIINGELDIQITYHETQDDANNGQDALASPYDNIVANAQTVYARAENTVTGCFTVVPLQLVVLPSPVVPVNIDDYVICDTNDDGFAQFNLTTKNAEILGAQPPADFTLTYHLSQANADTGANPIINVANYTNVGNPQTIYVRLVSAANGCVSTGQFDIRVELPPVAVQPTPLELCDDATADGFTSFDLTVKNTEITGGEGSWSVSYYLTNGNAQNGINAIDPATAYTNTVNPQTLFVRVTDTDTGCVDFVTLTIRVLPNPTPSLDPSDLELCDDINTGDGQEVFDLTLNQAYIINGEVGVTASYYTDLDDAEAGVNAIADPTAYTNANTDYTAQTIYVRVTNDVTGCYTIVQFNIIVNPLPEVVAVTDYIICELNNDGVASFDLTTKTAEVLNGQDPGLFTVTYHTTQANADNLNNALVSPYINVSNPQPIYVAITNNVTGCSISTQVFNLEVQEAAQANSDGDPIDYVICDNIGDNDGFGQFDLATQNPEVLDGQDPANYIVSYYFTEADAELGVNPLPFTYENVANPQVIYARVDNDTPDGLGADTSICYAVTPLTLQVNLLPIFDLEDSYTLCVDTNGTEVVNPPVLDTGLGTADYTFEWSLGGTVLPGETGSSLTATQPGVYSVLVTNNATGCENTDSAVVEESSPPTLVAEVATQAFSENHVIEAVATGDGTYEYSLDGGPWQSSGTFTNVSFGEHVVTARDIEGCGLVSVPVFVMDYPKFFTPNGDGYHDTWNIVGIGNQPSAKIYIFDRYGKLLKQLSPTGEGWNGTYNGEPMPTSDYWFTVEYNEPSTGQRKEFKAHFTLKR